jgi:hypothetical protein
MSLETAVYINTLDANQPAGDDPVAQADDHLRMIKAAVKATFPNLTGAVTPTQADLNTRLVPSGCILMWSGSVASIPANWALCNGLNGTPNLQDRFIVGAGYSYGVGAQGGSNVAGTTAAGGHSHTTDVQGTHSHGGSTGQHALTVDEIPAHAHGMGNVGLTFAHNGQGFYDQGGGAYGTTLPTGGNAPHSHPIYNDGAHGHNISYVGDHAHSIDTRSPYYALCFIMKL